MSKRLVNVIHESAGDTETITDRQAPYLSHVFTDLITRLMTIQSGLGMVKHWAKLQEYHFELLFAG